MAKLLVIISSLLIVVSAVAFAEISPAKGVGPETINLSKLATEHTKKEVIFPHWTHQRALNNECARCHGSGNKLVDQKTGKLLDTTKVASFANPIHDNFCFECHARERVVQVGRNCNSCHTSSGK